MLEKLKVVLEFSTSGISSITSSVIGFFKSIPGSVKGAIQSIKEFAQQFFFLKELFNTVSNAARKLFDTFIQGAGDAAKMEAKLKNVTGSAESAAAVMELLDNVAKQTGADFNELAAGSSLLAVAAKDAGGNFDLAKFTTLTDMLQRISALRPDVPIDRLARGLSTAVSKGDWSSLEMFLDVQLRQLIGIGEEAEKVGKVPGEIARGATYVETQTAGAANEALKSLDLLDQALTKAGATAGIVADVAELSGMERFNETLQSIARTVGKPLFDALNKGLNDLANWLQENPELVDQFATSLGNLGALGIEKVFEAITNFIANTNWETFFSNATEFFDKLTAGDLEGAFAAIKMPELGTGIEGALTKLGDIVEALGKIADVIIKVADFLGGGEGAKGIAGKSLGVAGGVIASASERGRKAGGLLEKIGAPDWVVKAGEFVSTLAGLTGTGLAQNIADTIGRKLDESKVQVNVSLDSSMLNAQIHNASGDVVADAFNRVSRNIAGEE